MTSHPTCIKCGGDLTDDNWLSANKAKHYYICKSCSSIENAKWRKNNHTKYLQCAEQYRRKLGGLCMSENRQCTTFLGIHIAENVLSNVFHNVIRMPNNHVGYDVICSKDMRIDIKSSCAHIKGDYAPYWLFMIKKNQIADFFLCIAFDDRENLTPLYLWLVPGNIVNHLVGTSISTTTLDKWSEYRLDIDKVVSCCNTMRK